MLRSSFLLFVAVVSLASTGSASDPAPDRELVCRMSYLGAPWPESGMVDPEDWQWKDAGDAFAASSDIVDDGADLWGNAQDGRPKRGQIFFHAALRKGGTLSVTAHFNSARLTAGAGIAMAEQVTAVAWLPHVASVEMLLLPFEDLRLLEKSREQARAIAATCRVRSKPR